MDTSKDNIRDRSTNTRELIYANSIVADEIALENKEKISKAVSESNKNRVSNSNSVQMGGNEIKEKKSHISPTHTREQVARLSGVGTGTVARYDAVMKPCTKNSRKKIQKSQSHFS